MGKKEKNVFISHHGKDDEHVTKIKDLLKDNGYILKNSSIDSTKPNQASDPDYIKGILRSQIKWAGTTIVLIGKDTHKREWVNWEIEESNKLEKKIIGVFIRGENDTKIPEALKIYSDDILGWQSDKIIDAIEGEDVGFENPDGSPMSSEYKPERLKCN